MDYTKLYNSIIDTAKLRKTTGYVEKHHVIPRSLGGTNNKSNIVSLTAKEHFVCHLLLTKMYSEGSQKWHKMIKAFMMMQCQSAKHSRYTGKLHENYRVRFSQVQSESQKGNKNSNFGTMWIHSMELEKSKKISKTEAIPDGWQKGRVVNFSNYAKKKLVKKKSPKHNMRRCPRCGQSVCKRPEVCSKYTMLRTFVKYFYLPEESYGSERIYIEYDKVKAMLYADYFIDMLSTIEITKKYNISSHQRTRHILLFLGFTLRSRRDALRNFVSRKALARY